MVGAVEDSEKENRKLKGVVVIGFDNDGEFYGASSIADGGSVMWLMEVCKRKMLEGT